MTATGSSPVLADTAGVDQARRVDWGRVAMVPLGVVLGGLALLRTAALLRNDDAQGVVGGAAAVVTGLLVTAFYAVLIRAYLRRGAARATTRNPLALVVAPLATALPFALPFAGAGASPVLTVVVGDLLLIIGFVVSVSSLRCLDRSLSVVAQARDLVHHGPYAWVRHPLYLGELVAMLGLALTLGGWAPLALWAALAGLQAYRAVQEERLLAVELPEYPAYQMRTARIVPGIF